MLRRGVSLLGVAALLACAILLLLEVVQGGRQSVALGNWPLPYAIEFAADALSAALVLLTAILGAGVLLATLRWGETAEAGAGLHPAAARACWRRPARSSSPPTCSTSTSGSS